MQFFVWFDFFVDFDDCCDVFVLFVVGYVDCVDFVDCCVLVEDVVDFLWIDIDVVCDDCFGGVFCQKEVFVFVEVIYVIYGVEVVVVG